MTVSGGTSAVPDDPIPADLRDRAVAAITRGYASDQLSDGELETLLDRVYGATTLNELNALIRGLPVLHTAAAGVGSADVAASEMAARPAQRISALFSGQERQLTGVAPRRLRVQARLGYVELDLTRATFEPGVTEIDVRALMGYVRLRLPRDVRVESEGSALFGFFSLARAGSPEAAGAERVVRVTGRAILGFAECHVGSGAPGRGADSTQ